MRRWWADANVPSFRLHSISVWGTRSHCELQPAHISTQQLDCCAFWLQECRRLPVRYAVFVSVAGLGFGGAGVTVGFGLCFREHFIFVYVTEWRRLLYSGCSTWSSSRGSHKPPRRGGASRRQPTDSVSTLSCVVLSGLICGHPLRRQSHRRLATSTLQPTMNCSIK